MITVKVARVPGKVVEVALEEGSTVRNAISTAGITGAEGASITIDEDEVGLDQALSDGDTILVANKSVKGA